MIERSHLKILRAVDAHGTLTSAADALCLTQSALSHTIKKLEGHFDISLWQKSGRHIELTAEGRFLLSEAKRLLPQLERIDETLMQYAKGEKGTLRIGIECHPCYQWLTKVVKQFLLDWPDVEVDVVQRFQFGGMSALFNRNIDFLVTPDPLVKTGVDFSPVFDFEQVLIVSQENTLAKKKVIEAVDLVEETLYSYPIEIDRLDIYKDFLLSSNCRPKKHKTIESSEMMMQLVAANRGVTTLPGWLASELEKNLAVKAKRLGKIGIHKKIYLGMRTDQSLSKFEQGFIKLATNLEGIK
ncbi:MAG: LysR family transcriptional regulator [Kangiellaceae bacterium]|nr:LysR family transcriptional regulator [Kangiellaceae bacterium]MCW8998668.1 LysR family transcriptional regulator [Kangiellaceae bacterium]MCW9017693.1 LysR family transcriptional regulator [Kangiellaceae bacterium]